MRASKMKTNGQNKQSDQNILGTIIGEKMANNKECREESCDEGLEWAESKYLTKYLKCDAVHNLSNFYCVTLQ